MSDHLKHTLIDVTAALKTAKALHAPDTLGFFWLVTDMGLEGVTDMGLEGVDLPRVIAILNKLPRQAVKELKERFAALDKIYGGSGQTFCVMDMGGTREVIDEWLDFGRWMDETKEAEAVMMRQVLDEVIPLLPNHDYPSVLEIVSEWYTYMP